MAYRHCNLPVLLIVGCGLSEAAAQPAPLPSAERRALFERMRANPADLELMFAFAAMAVREGDYEAAIATLERMLIFNPDLPRVKLELASAYYRLGAYDVARMHFDDVLAADPPPEVRDAVAPFLAEIDRRTATSAFSGFFSLGAVWSSNANLGPQDREVRAPFPGGVGLLPEDAVAAPSWGARIGAAVTHRYDLGGATENAWISTASYTGLRYASESAGEFDFVDVTTGPRLTVDGRQFGTTVRPFAQGGFLRSADEPLYSFGGGGIELASPLGPELNAFAWVSGNWRSFNDETQFDGFYALAGGGLAWAITPQTVMRGGMFVETDRTREEYTANNEVGLRFSLSQQIDAGRIDGLLAGPLTLTGFAQGSYRRFDGADPDVAPETVREDVDLRIGAQLTVPINRTLAVALDAAWFERFSNIRNYDLDNLEFGVSFVASF
jgi:hypothetical protein